MWVTRFSFPRCVAFAGLVLFCQPVFAQFRGVLQGTVKDSSGAVIGSANIKLTSRETQRQQTTVSSGDGFYHFAGLPPGSYDIEASAKGMSTAVMNGVNVAAEATTGIDITLQAGAITQSVTVTADTLPTIETETANISTNLTSEAIRNLPQVGRDPYE